MIEIKNHGDWVLYTPKRRRPSAPPSTLYAKRVKDGVDWYDYVKKNFTPRTIKLVVRLWQNALVVNVALPDETMLFPAGGTVLELFGYEGKDPMADFANCIYNPDDGSFTEPMTNESVA